MDLTPRQVQFASIGLDLIAREGMASVTFRSIAAEAGMSLGAVQKAFPTKELLLQAMFQRMRDAAVAPVLGEPGRPTLVGWLTNLSLQILPLDEPRRAAHLQGQAFGERAAFDPALAQALAASDAEIVGLVASLIGRGITEGEVAPGTDPQLAAQTWLVLVQGMANLLTYAPQPEEHVRTLIETALSKLFT